MILVWLILLPFIGGLLCWLSERVMGVAVPRWRMAGVVGALVS